MDPERTARREFAVGTDAPLTLVADTAGDPDGLPVLFLHGGGQTRSSWGRAVGSIASHPGRALHALTVDLRGHGESDRAPDGDYRLERFADDVRAIVTQLDQPPFLVGASLGGLAAMLAVTGPHAVLARGLVLVDVAPRVEVEGSERIRAFMRAAPDGFASLEEAGAAVSAYLPHRKAPSNLDGLRRNLREGADGRWRWHWDPAFIDGPHTASPASHRDMLEDAARSLTIPTLLLRGGKSHVVSAEGARAFLAITPHAELVDIAEADHMVAGDQNDMFDRAVTAFVDKQLAKDPTTPLKQQHLGGNSGG